MNGFQCGRIFVSKWNQFENDVNSVVESFYVTSRRAKILDSCYYVDSNRSIKTIWIGSRWAKLVAKWFFENEENLVKKDLRRYSIKISYSLGEKIQFPLSIELLHKEKDFLEAENRVTGASSFSPSRKTIHSLVKRSKNSRNPKFNLRKGCPEIQFSLKNVTIQKKKGKKKFHLPYRPIGPIFQELDR